MQTEANEPTECRVQVNSITRLKEVLVKVELIQVTFDQCTFNKYSNRQNSNEQHRKKSGRTPDKQNEDVGMDVPPPPCTIKGKQFLAGNSCSSHEVNNKKWLKPDHSKMEEKWTGKQPYSSLYRAL